MSVQHHLDDATLMRFAAGDLDEAFSVVVAAHLAMCDTCNRRLRAAQEIGGALMDNIDTNNVTLAPDALAQTLKNCLNATPEFENTQPLTQDAAYDDNVPGPLARYIETPLDNLSWKRVAPGIHRYILTPEDHTGSSLYMLKIAPGKKMPKHGHSGGEMTLVLKGAYKDEMGRFGPGDIADLDEHLEHQPIVEPDEECICLVATESLTKFKSPIDRMLQPFIGI